MSQFLSRKVAVRKGFDHYKGVVVKVISEREILVEMENGKQITASPEEVVFLPGDGGVALKTAPGQRSNLSETERISAHVPNAPTHTPRRQFCGVCQTWTFGVCGSSDCPIIID